MNRKQTIAACCVSAMALSLAFSVPTFAQGMAGPGMAQKDAFMGIWKPNMAKSHYDPASLTPKMGNTIKIDVSGNGTRKVTTDGTDAKGAPTHTEYTATQDNKVYPYKGSADMNSVAVKILDANTAVTVNKKGGTVVRILRSTVSKDGKTLTIVGVGYNAQGVAFHNVTVYDKQ
jgi:hypothetical protein